MSTVVHCVCARSGAGMAVKMYHKERLNSLNVRQVAREIEIHAALTHTNVVKLYAAFEDGDGIYLVQELAAGGRLRSTPAARCRFLPPCTPPLTPPLVLSSSQATCTRSWRGTAATCSRLTW